MLQKFVLAGAIYGALIVSGAACSCASYDKDSLIATSSHVFEGQITDIKLVDNGRQIEARVSVLDAIKGNLPKNVTIKTGARYSSACEAGETLIDWRKNRITFGGSLKNDEMHVGSCSILILRTAVDNLSNSDLDAKANKIKAQIQEALAVEQADSHREFEKIRIQKEREARLASEATEDEQRIELCRRVRKEALKDTSPAENELAYCNKFVKEFRSKRLQEATDAKQKSEDDAKVDFAKRMKSYETLRNKF